MNVGRSAASRAGKGTESGGTRRGEEADENPFSVRPSVARENCERENEAGNWTPAGHIRARGDGRRRREAERRDAARGNGWKIARGWEARGKIEESEEGTARENADAKSELGPPGRAKATRRENNTRAKKRKRGGWSRAWCGKVKGKPLKGGSTRATVK